MASYDEQLKNVFRTVEDQNVGDSIAYVDALYQYGENPTSMSAGYGITDNAQYIENNIRTRYGLTGGRAKEIVEFVHKSIEELQQATQNYDIYFWRTQARDFVVKYYLERIRERYDQTISKSSDTEKEKLSFLLEAVSTTGPSSFDATNVIRWFQCFFDPEEREREVIELKVVGWGITNKLYFKSSGSGYAEPYFVFPSYLKEVHDYLSSKLNREVPTTEQVKTYLDQLPLEQLVEIERMVNEKFPIGNPRIFPSKGIIGASKSATALSPFAIQGIKEALMVKRAESTRGFEAKIETALSQVYRETYPTFSYQYVLRGSGVHYWLGELLTTPVQTPLRTGILLTPWMIATSAYGSVYDDFIARTEYPDVEVIFVFEETIPSLKRRLTSMNVLRRYILFYDRPSEGFYLYGQPGIKSLDSVHVSEAEVFLGKLLEALRANGIKIQSYAPKELEQKLEIAKFQSKFPNLVALRSRVLEIEPPFREFIRKELGKDLGSRWEEEVVAKFGSKSKKWKSVADNRAGKDILDGATFGELIEVTRSFSALKLPSEKTVAALALLDARSVLIHPLEETTEDIPRAQYTEVELGLQVLDNFFRGTMPQANQ